MACMGAGLPARPVRSRARGVRKRHASCCLHPKTLGYLTLSKHGICASSLLACDPTRCRAGLLAHDIAASQRQRLANVLPPDALFRRYHVACPCAQAQIDHTPAQLPYGMQAQKFQEDTHYRLGTWISWTGHSAFCPLPPLDTRSNHMYGSSINVGTAAAHPETAPSY